MTPKPDEGGTRKGHSWPTSLTNIAVKILRESLQTESRNVQERYILSWENQLIKVKNCVTASGNAEKKMIKFNIHLSIKKS